MNGLLHGPARTRQGVGSGAAGSRDEVDIAGSAGSHTASQRQRRGVERDGAIGGGDVTKYRQRSGGSQSDVARRADRAAHDRHVAAGLDGDRPARGRDGIDRQSGLLVDGDGVAVGNGGGVDARVEPEIGHAGLQVNRAAGGLAKRHCHRGARDQAGGNARGGRLRHEVVLGGRAGSPQQVSLRGGRDRSREIDVGILGIDDHRAGRGNAPGGAHPHLAGLGRVALEVEPHVDGGQAGIDREAGEIGGGGIEPRRRRNRGRDPHVVGVEDDLSGSPVGTTKEPVERGITIDAVGGSTDGAQRGLPRRSDRNL